MRYLFLFLIIGSWHCRPLAVSPDGTPVLFVGSIERLDPALDRLIDPNERMVQLADGFTWSEGPVWVPAARMLLFSDVPENVIYRWTPRDGLQRWLSPSGYTGDGEYSREPGSNGLLLDQNGDLLLCQHGDRRVARVNLHTRTASPAFSTIASHYEDRRFNSPNDLIQASDGTIYFTDPPYGLPGQADSELREIPFFGVYRIDPTGEVTAEITNLSRPNGVALSPDERTLYVTVSDPKAAKVYAYDRSADGSITGERVFFDATPYVKDAPGLPDGLVIDEGGNMYVTGPGGVWIFNPAGKLLGKLLTGRATANVTIGNKGKVLYITADDVLLSLRLKGKSI